jgi:hypothetical protein
VPPGCPCREAFELPAPRPKVCEMEEVSAGTVSELGIPYENGEPVALDVKGFVVFAIEGVGPLCDEGVTGAIVLWTTDDKLGEASPVVITVIGFLEAPVGMICSMTGSGDNRRLDVSTEGSTAPKLAVVASGVCTRSKAPVASKDPRWSNRHLRGGGGGSSITGGRPRSLRDRRSSESSTV